MQELKKIVLSCLKGEGLSQDALAERAGVSQSTVSRAFHAKPIRHGAARQKLLRYASARVGVVDWQERDGVKRVAGAFSRIWDGSEAHADAVANVIGALAGLAPKSSRGKKGERRRHWLKSAPERGRVK